MKNTILSLTFLFCSFQALASGPFEPAQDLLFSCPGKKILDDGHVVECRGAKGFQDAKTANVGANISSASDVGIQTDVEGAIDLGILPDADTSPAYTYYRTLVSKKNGSVVGVLTTELWYNDEMGVKYKFKVRYTAAGKVAVITVD